MRANLLQEEDFIARIHIREEASFRLLFDTYHKALCYFATKIVNDREAAEDVVQDVFVAFWNTDMKGFPNVKTIKIFLYNSVQNRCLNYLRDKEIRQRNDLKTMPSEPDNDCFICQQIKAEVVAEIFAAVEELPEKCRKIFELAYIYGQEDKQIAELLGISLNTIKTQKQRAKAYLRKRLGELFIFTGLFFIGF